jgi:D-arabinose 1-dehydrogenase-like Zn-dependent alcohol dehydrogenase
MQRTMKAAVVRNFGKPLSIEEVPVPSPSPAPGGINAVSPAPPH